MTRGSGRGLTDCFVFEAFRDTGVDLVVPPAPNTPLGNAVDTGDFAGDLVRRAGFPASLLEFEETDFSRGPVLDLHGTVVVHGGVTRDDANNRAGHLLPGI